MTTEIGDVRQFLLSRKLLELEYKTPPGWRYPSIEDFLLTYGRQWKPAPLPPGVTRGKIKECFKNAIDYALEHPEVAYVEGYAWAHIPVRHAWCVDASGQVLELTWEPKHLGVDSGDYFGVAFNLEYVLRTMVRQETYGVLYNWKGNFAYMTEDPESFLDPRWRQS